ncbi:MAG: OmpA family protein [Pyrinomonadaceae bacterium]|nr:OmpA family protein [Pyrinomonadaceae bacterium]MCX7640345.1 OmpA family protein [Pyrinomonadaceae bacterium]MDW8304772.1 OmpA family protein [Acidobacteriota bacterium]
MKKIFLVVLGVALSLSVLAQDAIRKVPAGQKMKVKGVVIARDKDRLIVRDALGVDTSVVITGSTSIKTKSSLFRSGEKIGSTQIVRGLNLEVEGIGDGENLIANKIRFDKDDLEVARTVDSRVTPTEERLSQVEQNAERLSGQIDELMAISNAARGGAKAAQETADAAVEGVNATNARITAIDDYVVHSSTTVYFKVGSAALSPEAKAQLDKIAQTAMTLKGYIIEVTGFASSDGDEKTNKILSERRAKAVIDYLVQTHNIPLRRIGQSYGFGELQPAADNTTPSGRAQNRRVEVKILVSRGLNQNVEVRLPNTQRVQ